MIALWSTECSLRCCRWIGRERILNLPTPTSANEEQKLWEANPSRNNFDLTSFCVLYISFSASESSGFSCSFLMAFNRCVMIDVTSRSFPPVASGKILDNKKNQQINFHSFSQTESTHLSLDGCGVETCWTAGTGCGTIAACVCTWYAASVDCVCAYVFVWIGTQLAGGSTGIGTGCGSLGVGIEATSAVGAATGAGTGATGTEGVTVIATGCSCGSLTFFTGFGGSTGTHSLSFNRWCWPDETGNCIRIAFVCSDVFGGIGVAFYEFQKIFIFLNFFSIFLPFRHCSIHPRWLSQDDNVRST